MSIYVCGALHLDVIVTAARLPRLDETLMGENVLYRLGGKGGNQAVTAARLGAEVCMAGCVGNDDYGAVILSELKAAGVKTDKIRIIDNTASGMSVAIVNAEGEYGAVVVSAANKHLADRIPVLCDDTQIVLLQNEIPETVNIQTARRAKAQKCLVILNAAPFRPLGPELAEYVDVIIVNRTEAGDMLGLNSEKLPAETELLAGLSQAGFTDILLTAGENGVYACQGGSLQHYPAPKITLLSAHGAGDAFAGGLAAGLLAGCSRTEAIMLGQKAAAYKISLPADRHAQMTRSGLMAL